MLIKDKKAVLAVLGAYVAIKAGDKRRGLRILAEEIEENTVGVDRVMDGLAKSVVPEEDVESECIDSKELDDYEFVEGEEDEGDEEDYEFVEGESEDDEDSDDGEEETVEVSEAVARALNLSY